MTEEREPRKEVLDVLIVTAIKEECDAVLAVETGTEPGASWQRRAAVTGLELFERSFAAKDGTLRFAVTRALGMGGVNAVIAASPLLQAYEVRCLAMCGVCAGRRDEVMLGDVIIADRAWTYDAGKVKVELDSEGIQTECKQGDVETYSIRPRKWKQAAERFLPDPSAPWLALRPRSYESQGDWLLERVLKEQDSVTHPAAASRCPDRDKALKLLWKVKRLEPMTTTLTAAGRRHIEELVVLHPDGLPEPRALKIAVGALATGSPVVEDPAIFGKLSSSVRKVLGLEMEASAVAALGDLSELAFTVVMKGVMDHADAFKSDNFKTFAARASAECLIAFLRANLPSAASNRVRRSPTDPPAPARPRPPAARAPGDGIMTWRRRTALTRTILRLRVECLILHASLALALLFTVVSVVFVWHFSHSGWMSALPTPIAPAAVVVWSWMFLQRWNGLAGANEKLGELQSDAVDVESGGCR
jgi:nucleoside phosphorylase